MRRITVNGELRETSATDLDGLFAELDLPTPLMLVEYNGAALTRSEWQEIIISDGDRFELMKVAAGG